jgi:hypothetical protein
MKTTKFLLVLFFSIAVVACGGGGGSSGNPPQRYLFVTSQRLYGNLGGLAGADALCSQDASAGGLKGTWRAWLSDKKTNVLTRINDVGPWHIVGTSTVAAKNLNTLVVGPPNLAWSDQNGNTPPVNDNGIIDMWTGTNTSGSTDLTCADWTSSSGGDGGTYITFYDGFGSNQPVWTSHGNPCSYGAPLLCIQQ